MPRTARLFWFAPMLIALPAMAQDADLAELQDQAADAGWTLSRAPEHQQDRQEHPLLLLKDDAIIAMAAVERTGASPDGALRLSDLRMLQARPGSRSGELRAQRLTVPDFEALDMLLAPATLAEVVCQRGPGRPLDLVADSVELSADPDAMARGQAEPETLRLAQLTLSAARTGAAEPCRIEIQASGRMIELNAADATRAEVEGIALNARGEADRIDSFQFDLRIDDASAHAGTDLLLEFSMLALEFTHDDLTVLPETDDAAAPGLLAGLATGQGALRFEMTGFALPLRGLLPADIALPEEILRQIPQERIAGGLALQLTLAQGAAQANLDADLSGLTRLHARMNAQLPATPGGMEVLPGVPPEITGMSLDGAELSWQDMGADAIVTHYSGEGIAQHADRLLAPAARVLPEALVTQLRSGVADWLALGLSGEAWLSLAPQEPVSLARVASQMLFSPAAVPELIGLKLER